MQLTDLIISPCFFDRNFAADICFRFFFFFLMTSHIYFFYLIHVLLSLFAFFKIFFILPDCKPIGDCQTLGGQCSHIASGQCPTGLVKIPNGCSGFECTCCVGTSGLISCPVSATCPGRCRDARVCPVVMTNTSCSTTGCACCLGKYKETK